MQSLFSAYAESAASRNPQNMQSSSAYSFCEQRVVVKVTNTGHKI
jgi:hypothetical protein